MQSLSQSAIKHKLGLLNLAVELGNVSSIAQQVLAADRQRRAPPAVAVG